MPLLNFLSADCRELGCWFCVSKLVDDDAMEAKATLSAEGFLLLGQ
jgi:hypothetical protein